jgi:CRP/FNR family transcriptional regulator, cyclic AMP receptor protein
MKTLAPDVSENPLFKALKPEYREILAEGALEKEYAAGATIFRQGEPANRLYLVLSGSVALEAAGEKAKGVTVQCLSKGEVLGWSWLFPPFAWQFSARAVQPCTLLVLDGARLLVHCEENPTFGFEVMKQLAPVVIRRLQSTRRKLLASPNAKLLNREPVSTPKAAAVKSEQEGLEELIRKHPFTRGMKEEHLKEMVQNGMLLQFNEGETIFREGDVANRFYLVESGSVVLEAPLKDHSVVPLQVIGAGDVLGWSWLFPPYYWHFNARATQPTRAIFFYGTRLRETCEEKPALGCDLMKRMIRIVIQRLQATRKHLVEAQVSENCP